MKLLFINQSIFLVPFKLWMEAYLRTEYNWQLSNKTFFLDYFPHYFVTSLKIKILETVLSRYLVNCIVGFSSIYQSKTFKNELPLAIFTRFDQTRSFFASTSFFPNSNVFLPNLTGRIIFRWPAHRSTMPSAYNVTILIPKQNPASRVSNGKFNFYGNTTKRHKTNYWDSFFFF